MHTFSGGSVKRRMPLADDRADVSCDLRERGVATRAWAEGGPVLKERTLFEPSQLRRHSSRPQCWQRPPRMRQPCDDHDTARTIISSASACAWRRGRLRHRRQRALLLLRRAARRAGRTVRLRHRLQPDNDHGLRAVLAFRDLPIRRAQVQRAGQPDAVRGRRTQLRPFASSTRTSSGRYDDTSVGILLYGGVELFFAKSPNLGVSGELTYNSNDDVDVARIGSASDRRRHVHRGGALVFLVGIRLQASASGARLVEAGPRAVAKTRALLQPSAPASHRRHHDRRVVAAEPERRRHGAAQPLLARVRWPPRRSVTSSSVDA